MKGNGDRIDVVLRDISRAFDKVWHGGLRYKLLQTDLPNRLIRLISDYLTDRTANIRIDDYIGPTFALSSGLPQGGCLSPTLFTFYTHDLPDPPGNTHYISYADDITQIVPYSGKGKYMHAYTTSRAITHVNRYEHKWKIQTNKDKFQVINIGTHRTVDIPHHNIAHSTSGKALGLNIYSTSLTRHIKQRRNIANAQMNKLYRFKNLSEQNKRTLYLALVRSKLLYPIVPIHTVSKTQMLSLQRIQNKATRFITNTSKLDFLTSELLHALTDLEPINIVTHKQAQKIWDNIENKIGINIRNTIQLSPDKTYTSLFPSSYNTALRDIPTPLFA